MKKLLLFFVFLLSTSIVFSQVELGGTTNYSEVEEDGTLEFHGDATVWNDFVVTPALKVNQANGPTWQVFKGDIYALAFGGGSQDGQVFFDIQLPHGWNEGSTIYPHIHWAPEDNSGGNIIWYLDYTWASKDGVFPEPTTINSGVVAVGTTAYKHMITPIPASGGISGSGQTISSVLRCRLWRDPTGSDTYSGDAFALSIDIHYEENTVGSREQFTK